MMYSDNEIYLLYDYTKCNRKKFTYYSVLVGLCDQTFLTCVFIEVTRNFKLSTLEEGYD